MTPLGERSVGVNRADETDAGEKSGELGVLSMFSANGEGLWVKGAGELRFNVRNSCSTCCIVEKKKKGVNICGIKNRNKRNITLS